VLPRRKGNAAVGTVAPWWGSTLPPNRDLVAGRNAAAREPARDSRWRPRFSSPPLPDGGTGGRVLRRSRSETATPGPALEQRFTRGA
jgi:hypothetical protein